MMKLKNDEPKLNSCCKELFCKKFWRIFVI
jgi:hypothetical protein